MICALFLLPSRRIVTNRNITLNKRHQLVEAIEYMGLIVTSAIAMVEVVLVNACIFLLDGACADLDALDFPGHLC